MPLQLLLPALGAGDDIRLPAGAPAPLGYDPEHVRRLIRERLRCDPDELVAEILDGLWRDRGRFG